MQDKLMISIIDDNGSRQFSVHRLVQKVALFTGVGMVSMIILYFVMAHFLMSELEVILANNNQVRENFQNIYEKNSALERDIDYKTNELLKVNSKVSELESIVNVRKHSNELYNNQDIDIDALTPLQKDMILKIIPNGNPVDDFASKNFPNKGASTYHLTKASPVYATANGIIDSVRVAGSENQFVQIQHSYGFTSNYGHLRKVIVQKGDFVTKGQVIGYSGAGVGLYYDLRFIDSALDVANYTDWNSDNFAQIVGVNSVIDWKNLVWALNDIIQLKNYRVSYQDNEKILAY
ncbi:M23 family metallopeptidase [Helicobacter sp. MIT 21-1697]|uniref:M23 family metallopeptidase n=1 Tax=Helicobacter sp. MIT 21-1697 TaxID=2993733 RepID=UPI00224AF098|nr:M23 family metallopeptidase [Helicobacter sp. MIT 21-1697]MCX2716390.1 M23 family metallopeptidase [Helicobacter sp. MIT 21-1697]